MSALLRINEFQAGDVSILKREKWLQYLALTNETYINYERVEKISTIQSNYNLLYVKRSLDILASKSLSLELHKILEDVLKWSEVSKTGNKVKRVQWVNKSYNLYVHNIGSAQIYADESNEESYNEMTTTLIMTHGLIGQYLRGEVSLDVNVPLYELLEKEEIDTKKLSELLYHLNHCIIGAVSIDLWNNLEAKVTETISLIVHNKFSETFSIENRIQLLRNASILNGEDFVSNWKKIESSSKLYKTLEDTLNTYSLWYIEAALHDFSFLEFCKIISLMYISVEDTTIINVSFERMMRDIYYDHNGIKRVNIYKKRIIEKYLESMTMEEIENNQIKQNIHVNHKISIDILNKTAFFELEFSPVSSKLIEFCELSENSESVYEKAVIMLFDMFGFRKDQFDRFYNEEEYLKTMNQSINHKSIIVDHIVGNKVLDIGPGGGALMNMIEDYNPDLDIIGLDISQNVIDSLQKMKLLHNRSWNVIKGDALNLSDYIKEMTVDTVIFSSIIHEMYSYIEYNGKQFNPEVIQKALISAYEVLTPGGRIIIRDGIMSEPKNQNRIIKFRSKEGMKFLDNYVEDFKGRDIKYSLIGHNEVLMNINDAMEFLYTYTWGEESYVHEVNEQFGYFTPSEYQNFITETLGDKIEIKIFNHYLQEGYSVALDTKVEFLDENRNKTVYPDSTCFIVIEKRN